MKLILITIFSFLLTVPVSLYGYDADGLLTGTNAVSDFWELTRLEPDNNTYLDSTYPS
jgi:hypothetical protein